MKLIAFLSAQIDLLQYEIIDIKENDGINSITLQLSNSILPVSITPRRGYHAHDGFSSHPVALKHEPTPTASPIVAQIPSMYSNNPDYIMDCDSIKCEQGKYPLANGTYNICYRCDGKGWISQSKHNKNIEYDRKRNA